MCFILGKLRNQYILEIYKRSSLTKIHNETSEVIQNSEKCFLHLERSKNQNILGVDVWNFLTKMSNENFKVIRNSEQRPLSLQSL